ncbi:hypothetical protein CRUP_018981 [Coryphaenoides rupestris]|nr:hypothetical protein CRUP_018981 [Coryphaenoides rupestris]
MHFSKSTPNCCTILRTHTDPPREVLALQLAAQPGQGVPDVRQNGGSGGGGGGGVATRETGRACLVDDGQSARMILHKANFTRPPHLRKQSSEPYERTDCSHNTASAQRRESQDSTFSSRPIPSPPSCRREGTVISASI